MKRRRLDVRSIRDGIPHLPPRLRAQQPLPHISLLSFTALVLSSAAFSVFALCSSPLVILVLGPPRIPETGEKQDLLAPGLHL